jgi:aryl-alcohol dehydrogenase (NADP+)
MYAWQFSKYLHTQERLGKTKFVSMQNFYNLIYREEEREMLPLCRDQGIGVIPWSPLARGFLARSRDANTEGTTRSKSDVRRLEYSEADYEVLGAVTKIAREKGVPNSAVALAWVMAQPGLTAPIVGATKMSHLDDALTAVTLELSAAEIEALSKPYQPKAITGHT